MNKFKLIVCILALVCISLTACQRWDTAYGGAKEKHYGPDYTVELDKNKSRNS